MDVPSVLIAISAMVSAVASVVVAIFSVGTWRLYGLERERDLRAHGRFAAHVVRLRRRLEADVALTRTASFAGEEQRELRRGIFAAMQEELRDRRLLVERLTDEAAGVPMKTIASLDVAHILLRQAERTARRLGDATENEADFGRRQQQLASLLEEAAKSMGKGYDALPRSEQGWEPADYEQVLDEALAPMRRMMETARTENRSGSVA